MLKNKISKLESQLALKKISFVIWICPKDPPPEQDPSITVLTIIEPDGSLTNEQIKLKEKYLRERD